MEGNLPPTKQTFVKLRNFAELHLRTFSTNSFELDNCTDFKAFFPAVLTDFRQPASVKS